MGKKIVFVKPDFNLLCIYRRLGESTCECYIARKCWCLCPHLILERNSGSSSTCSGEEFDYF